ncbi:MAG: EamA family transporter RarD [Desulfuromonadaceae bacterium]|nr:EamA family transporter RarD [Desulfuromonadaceae bacterium]
MREKPEQCTHRAAGLGYGVLAYLIWGFFPVYFKALSAVPAFQVVSHRIIWSLLFLWIIIVVRGKWRDLRDAFLNRTVLVLLTISALLIATNWLVFIIAVGHAQVIQSSLGYFMTPFVSVLLGVFFLKERLRRLQLVSLLLAAIGVLLLTFNYGRFPWVALALALTFGCYGLLRKVVAVDSLTGLTVETLLLGPVALGYLIFLSWQGKSDFLMHGQMTGSLLVLAGVATAVPLLLFASAARRLRLATIGFLQYITPTLHFLLAVVLYKEPFSRAHLASFLCIWSGLCCYSFDAYRGVREQRKEARRQTTE